MYIYIYIYIYKPKGKGVWKTREKRKVDLRVCVFMRGKHTENFERNSAYCPPCLYVWLGVARFFICFRISSLLVGRERERREERGEEESRASSCLYIVCVVFLPLSPGGPAPYIARERDHSVCHLILSFQRTKRKTEERRFLTTE